MSLFTRQKTTESWPARFSNMLQDAFSLVSNKRFLFLASFLIILVAVPFYAHAGPVEDALGNIGKSFVDGIVSGIGKVIAAILWVFVAAFGLLLRAVGVALNWVVLVTVFQFSSYFGNSNGMLLAWTTLRDLANIILLFGFVWIGLQTILNVGHHFSVGKALPRLLIFAILINFSLFISEAVVDVSNVFTAVLYEQAGDVKCDNTAAQVECVNKGISGSVLGAIGFSSVLNALSIGAQIFDPDTHGGQAAFSMMLLLLLIIILITIFLAMSIMLLARSVVLIFLLVLSPLGFVGMAIPQFEEQAQKWWKMLISNSFFAPILFILLFVSLKIMEGAKATFGGGADFATAIMVPGASIGGAFILFGLMTGFLVFSLVAAKSMGAFGAEFATNTAGKMTGAMTFGAGAAIGRKFIGAYAHNRAEKLREQGADRTHAGRMQLKTWENLGKGSYDVRQAKVFGVDIGKNAAKAAKIDFGDGKKGGYTGELHEIEEARVKAAKGLKNTTAEVAEIKQLEGSLESNNAAHAQDLKEIDARNKLELAPQEERVKQLREAALEAQKTGNQLSINNAETALNNELRVLAAAKEKQAEARTAIDNQHKEWVAGVQAEIDRIKKAPQREFAKNLSEGPRLDILGETGNRILRKGYGYTTQSVGDHHAAAAIIKNMNKKDTDKIMDALSEMQSELKSVKGKVGSGGGGGGDSHGKEDSHAH